MVFIHCPGKAWHVSFLLRQHMLFDPRHGLIHDITRREHTLSAAEVLVRPTFLRAGFCPAHSADTNGKAIKAWSKNTRRERAAIAVGKELSASLTDKPFATSHRQWPATRKNSADGGWRSLLFLRVSRSVPANSAGCNRLPTNVKSGVPGLSTRAPRLSRWR